MEQIGHRVLTEQVCTQTLSSSASTSLQLECQMTRPLVELLTAGKPMLIGMLHLPALPGSPQSSLSIREIEKFVMNDLAALAGGPVDAIMVENFGDVPFYPSKVPPITIASMSRLGVAVRDQWAGPLGINVLRNDGEAALGVAAAVEADFIRVNVLTGARVTDQGIISGTAHDLLRLRKTLQAENIQIWADCDVKHSAPLAERPLIEEAQDQTQRGGADALILTGHSTGAATDTEGLESLRRSLPDTPLIVGSGVTPESVARYTPWSNGLIVGTVLKEDGNVRRPVCPKRVAAMVEVVRQ